MAMSCMTWSPKVTGKSALEQSVPFALEHPIPEHLREREREDGNAPVARSYTIRAAFTDVFGPPAIAYQTIFPQE